MPEIAIPDGERPSYGKYVAYTVIGLLLVNWVVAFFAEGLDSPVLGLAALLVAAILNVTVVFLMVQSLIEEWFAAAEVVEESSPDR